MLNLGNTVLDTDSFASSVLLSPLMSPYSPLQVLWWQCVRFQDGNNINVSHSHCVPFWNMCHPIDIVCRSEKCAILKHAPDWYCANFVISKPHFKCKVKKHWNLCKETEVRPSYCIYLFICFSIMNVGLLQIQWVKKSTIVVCPWYGRVFTVPVCSMFHNGTFFRTAHNANLKTCFGMANVSE